MKTKLLGTVLLCVIVMSGSVVSAIDTDITTKDFTKLYEESPENNNETRTFFSTYGPLSHRITKITLLDGPPSQITRIERIIDRKVLQFLRPFTVVPVTNINFTITYKKDILFDRSKFSYVTTLVEYENGNRTNMLTFHNDMHTAIVKEFTGSFIFMRAHPFRKPLKIHPALFMFLGYCEQAMILA